MHSASEQCTALQHDRDRGLARGAVGCELCAESKVVLAEERNASPSASPFPSSSSSSATVADVDVRRAPLCPRASRHDGSRQRFLSPSLQQTGDTYFFCVGSDWDDSVDQIGNQGHCVNLRMWMCVVKCDRQIACGTGPRM